MVEVQHTRGHPSPAYIEPFGKNPHLEVKSWKNLKPWHALHFEGKNVHFKLKIKNDGDLPIKDGEFILWIAKLGLHDSNGEELRVPFSHLGIKNIEKGVEREIKINIPYDYLAVGSFSISLYADMPPEKDDHRNDRGVFVVVKNDRRGINIYPNTHFLKVYPWNIMRIIDIAVGAVLGFIIGFLSRYLG